MLDCAFDSDGEPSEECASCERPVSDLPTEPDGYEHWPACPNKLRLLPMWQSVIASWNAAQVCPLADWPHGYVAWHVRGILALQAAFAAKREQKDKESETPPGLQTPSPFGGSTARRGPVYGGPSPWR
jgi:hypothetical protein